MAGAWQTPFENYTQKKDKLGGKNPNETIKLDFFFISDYLIPFPIESDIKPGYRTDYSIFTLELRFNYFKRGRGLWKFNNSLLYENEYLETI